MCLIFLRKFGKLIFSSSIFLIFLCTSGCLQGNFDESPETYEVKLDGHVSGSRDEKLCATENYAEYAPYVETDFDSVIGAQSFHTWGTVILRGEKSLPYLMLNATLWDGEKLACKTKYMLIDIKPEHEYSFDISENKCFDANNSYLCVLEIFGPDRLITSESRQCLIMDPYSKNTNRIYGDSISKAAAEDLYNEVTTTAPRYIDVEVSDEPRQIMDLQQTTSTVDEISIPDEGGQELIQPGDLCSTTACSTELSSSFEAPVEPRSYSGFSGSLPEQEYYVGSDGAYNVVQVEPPEVSVEVQVANSAKEAISMVSSTDSLQKTDRGMYVGSTTSDKYHEPGCRYATKIRSENEIWFEDAEDAQSHGYIPCKVCNPS